MVAKKPKSDAWKRRRDETIESLVIAKVAEAIRILRIQHDGAVEGLRERAMEEIKNTHEHASQRIDEISATCAERIKNLKDALTEARAK